MSCLARLWDIWFWLKKTSLLLSHRRIGVKGMGTLIRFISHTISAAVLATPRYSDSQLDQAIVGCFFALHETRFPPRKIEYPYVKHRVSTHLAQSASEYPRIKRSDRRVKLRPKWTVPLMYLRIRLTTSKWYIVGDCKNWLAWFTAYERPGRVIVRYCKAPTKER